MFDPWCSLDHKTYDEHGCEESYLKDVRVPVCPLCDQPVPVSRGEDPNARVDQHIRNDCKGEAAKKLYINKCAYKGCKKKEVVQVNCSACHKMFCLKHRLETAHDCEGPPNRIGSKPVNADSKSRNLSSVGAELHKARLARQRQESHHHGATKMSDDEALTAAIAASLNDSSAPEIQQAPQVEEVDEDEALAKAVAASLQDSVQNKSGQKREQSSNDTCSIM